MIDSDSDKSRVSGEVERRDQREVLHVHTPALAGSAASPAPTMTEDGQPTHCSQPQTQTRLQGRQYVDKEGEDNVLDLRVSDVHTAGDQQRLTSPPLSLHSPRHPVAMQGDGQGHRLAHQRDRQGQGQVHEGDRQSHGQMHQGDRHGQGQGQVHQRDRQGHGHMHEEDRQGQGQMHQGDRQGQGQMHLGDKQGQGHMHQGDSQGQGQVAQGDSGPVKCVEQCGQNRQTTSFLVDDILSPDKFRGAGGPEGRCCSPERGLEGVRRDRGQSSEMSGNATLTNTLTITHSQTPMYSGVGHSLHSSCHFGWQQLDQGIIPWLD